MRALSLAQAHACEMAAHPACKCRCGGKLHGALRHPEILAERDWYETLPKDDPHHLPDKAERKQKRKDARDKRRLTREPRQIFLYDIFAEEDHG